MQYPLKHYIINKPGRTIGVTEHYLPMQICKNDETHNDSDAGRDDMSEEKSTEE